MSNWHIHIKGVVQGVGFRPYVYRLAHQFGIKGWVNNDMDGVHIVFESEEKDAQTFYQALLDNPPALSKIVSSVLMPSVEEKFSDFRIVHSRASGMSELKITPDFAMCRECAEEISASGNRRYGYAFTTCTHCGPRFSIIEKLPYDREHTSMAPYKMCALCQKEYEDPLDRRYYSQTNSCRNCGVQMQLLSSEGELISVEDGKIPEWSAELLRRGKIMAVKGIGGYLILLDASNEEAVSLLRLRKGRPEKPFALMYPSLERIRRDLWVSKAEEQLLLSSVSPIVLLRCKRPKAVSAQVAPGLSSLGVMLPYTPLFYLLANAFGHPLVATSGNISGSPVLFDDELALKQLGPIVDFILTNDRAIVQSQDDSVLRVAPRSGKTIVLRRSRGLAPNCYLKKEDFGEKSILALGAHYKAAFAMSYAGNVYVSQYLGAMDGLEAQLNFERTLRHFTKVLKFSPSVVITDKHPGYFTHELGRSLAEEKGIPLFAVQHHKAHFAAVLAEAGLLDIEEPVLGVVWDGTGYGDDDQIWGGEFFVFAGGKIERLSHLPYFPVLSGDKMSVEPRLSALSFFGPQKVLKEKFSEQEWRIYTRLLDVATNVETSSMGRIFDAVACVLGLADKMTYEAQAAVLLEQLAAEGGGHDAEAPVFYVPLGEDMRAWRRAICRGVLRDLEAGLSPAEIARKFHETLVQMILAKAAKTKVKRVAFSGGVFQNALLVDLLKQRMSCSFDLYFHEQLPAGDENIPLGQLAFYYLQERSKLKKESHVFSYSGKN